MGDELVEGVLTDAAELVETEAEDGVVDNGGGDLGVDDAGGKDAEAVLFGVADEGGAGVEAHGLAVEEGGVELGGAVDFEPDAGVGDEGEADGVTFWEAVEGEGADAFDDAVLDGGIDLFAGHGGAEFVEGFGHAFCAAAEAHGAAEFFGFGAVEVGDDHGHFEDLLLEEGDAEGALEDGLEAGVDVVDGSFAIATVEVGVDHFADDGAGADDGDFDDDVVEAFGFHAGEGGHLGAAFDLEDADGVGALHHGEGGGVVFGEVGEIDGAAAASGGG